MKEGDGQCVAGTPSFDSSLSKEPISMERKFPPTRMCMALILPSSVVIAFRVPEPKSDDIIFVML